MVPIYFIFQYEKKKIERKNSGIQLRIRNALEKTVPLIGKIFFWGGPNFLREKAKCERDQVVVVVCGSVRTCVCVCVCVVRSSTTRTRERKRVSVDRNCH